MHQFCRALSTAGTAYTAHTRSGHASHLGFDCLICTAGLRRMELIGVHSTASAALTYPLPMSSAQAAWLLPSASPDALCCLVRCSPGQLAPGRTRHQGLGRPELAVAVLTPGSTQLCHPSLLQVSMGDQEIWVCGCRCHWP